MYRIWILTGALKKFPFVIIQIGSGAGRPRGRGSWSSRFGAGFFLLPSLSNSFFRRWIFTRRLLSPLRFPDFPLLFLLCWRWIHRNWALRFTRPFALFKDPFEVVMEHWKTGDFSSQSIVAADLVPSSSLQPQPLSLSSSRHHNNQLPESRFVMNCGFWLTLSLYPVSNLE